MDIHIFDSVTALGAAAAKEGAAAIRDTLARKGRAAIILATGASQFEMLDALVAEDIDWSKITVFHLDEYVGISIDHPASFRNYLRQRFVERVGTDVEFIAINGDAPNLDAEIARINDRIAREQIDVCFAGIGENCHLAFNDPPADFDTETPYLVVSLDAACRNQQMGEGWFATIDDVPQQAVSMSIKQIMKSGKLILAVPDQRKAQAVKDAVEGPVTNIHPASIVQQHPACSLYLDGPSASLLEGSCR